MWRESPKVIGISITDSGEDKILCRAINAAQTAARLAVREHARVHPPPLNVARARR